MNRINRVSKIFSTLFIACLGFCSALTNASDMPPLAAKNSIVVHTQLATPATSQGPSRTLLAKAFETGTVRVIVGLDLDMAPAHRLNQSQAASQAAVLSTLKTDVLAEVFGSGPSGVITKFEVIPFMTLEVSGHQLRKLLADPRVKSVQEDGFVAPMLKASTKLIRANRIWKPRLNLRGAGQTIAILDTGSHHAKMLSKQRIVAGGCYSTNDETYGSESLCPGGASVKTNKASGKNCSVSIPGCDHGTHVATIAAGDSGRLKGVAREASIIRIQVFSKFTNPVYCGPVTPCVIGWDSNIIQALERVYGLLNKYSIAAVNMSLGGGYYPSHCDDHKPAMAEIIDLLTDAGVAVVVASGNDGLNGYISSPACIENAIAVGNTTKTDHVASSSNHSELVDLLAPGENIYAGVPRRSYAFKSGTSMAAPHVAGAFALLKGYKPGASVEKLLAALECSGKLLSRGGVSKPRIDVRSAYKFLKQNQTDCMKRGSW